MGVRNIDIGCMVVGTEMLCDFRVEQAIKLSTAMCNVISNVLLPVSLLTANQNHLCPLYVVLLDVVTPNMK